LPEIETHSIDPSTASPGAILKRCREYHELSLEEAEESTKIGANYLQALEEDQISQFASLAYLKGFLRIYATYLGLNPDDMIRLYEKLYTSGRAPGEQNAKATGNGEPSPRKRFPMQKLILPAILLMLILITAAIINRSPAPPLRQNPPAPVAVSVPISAVQPVRSSFRPPPPAQQPEETLNAQPRPDSPPLDQIRVKSIAPENSKGFIVKMKVSQGGSLTVTIDGSTSQSYDLVASDSIEWKADRSVTLELSNSGGVDVELNGRQLKPFGQPGKPAVIVLDADGVRQ
jgi:cytoskeletal protein RodZ